MARAGIAKIRTEKKYKTNILLRLLLFDCYQSTILCQISGGKSESSVLKCFANKFEHLKIYLFRKDRICQFLGAKTHA